MGPQLTASNEAGLQDASQRDRMWPTSRVSKDVDPTFQMRTQPSHTLASGLGDPKQRPQAAHADV